MTTGVFAFTFAPSVPILEAEMTLHLAVFAAEGLYGESLLRLDFSYHVETSNHVIYVDGSNDVGASVAQMFTSLLTREFGQSAFRVRPVGNSGSNQRQVAA